MILGPAIMFTIGYVGAALHTRHTTNRAAATMRALDRLRGSHGAAYVRIGFGREVAVRSAWTDWEERDYPTVEAAVQAMEAAQSAPASDDTL